MSKRSNENGEARTAAGKPRRRWLKRLLWTVGILLVIFVGGLLYLTSGHAIRNIYLPLAGEQIGTEISAGGAGLSFGGVFYLEDFKIQGDGAEPAFEMALLRVDINPLSALGGIPTVNEVRIESPHVQVALNEDGSSNWDFVKRLGEKAPAAPKEPKPSAPADSPKAFPSLTIDRVAMDDFRLEVTDPSGRPLLVRDTNLAIENIAPGATGTVAFELAADVNHPELDVDETLTYNLATNFTQAEGGLELGWDGTMMLRAVPGGGRLAAVGEVQVDTTFDGSVDIAGNLTQTLRMLAQTPQGEAGRIEADVAWTPEAQKRTATLSISDIDRKALNPILALGGMSMESGTIGARLDAGGDTDQTTVEAEFQAAGMSFRLPGATGATPPLTVSFNQNSRLAPAEGRFTLEGLTLSVNESNQALLTVGLDEPMTIRTGGSAGSAPEASPARLEIKLAESALSRFEPWARVFSAVPPGGLPGGRIGGDWQLEVADQGNQVAFGGDLRLSALTLAEPKVGPLNLVQRVQVRVEQMQQVTLETVETRLSAGERNLMTNTVKGQLNLAEGTGKLMQALSLPDVQALAKVAGASLPPTVTERSPGRLALNNAINLSEGFARAGVDGTLTLEGFETSAADAAMARPYLATSYAVAADTAAGRLGIDPLRVVFDRSDGADLGWLEVKGDLPMAPGPNATGEVNLTAKGLNATAWLALLNAAPEQPMGDIVIEADQKVEVAGLDTATVNGTVTIDLPAADPAAEKAQSLTLTVREQVRVAAQEIEQAVVEITSTGRTDANDRMRISATGRLGEQPRIEIDGRIENFGLDPYMAWVKKLTGGEKEKDKEKEEEPEPAEEQPGADKPLPTVIAQLQVDNLQYRRAYLRESLIKARIEDGVIEASIENSSDGAEGLGAQLAGGTLAASLMFDRSREDPRYSWMLNMDSVQVGHLLEMASEQMAQRLNGAMTLDTRGSGEGFDREDLRQLSAGLSFRLADGSVGENKLLSAISNATGTDVFKQLSFSEFTGGVDVAEGVLKLQDWSEGGLLQKLSASGEYDLVKNMFQVDIQPSIGSSVVKDLGNTQLVSALVKDASGYLRLPMEIRVSGEGGGDYSIMPRITLHEQAGELLKGGAEALGKGATSVGEVGGLLGGAVNDALGNVLGGGSKEKEVPEAEAAASTDTQRTTPTETPGPGKSGGVLDRAVNDALGGLLGGGSD